MKKSIFAFCALGAVAGVASAQSSVTVYGVVDVAVRNTKNNSGSTLSQVSGSNSSSRLGFRGTEDLGGGLSANFTLEADVFPDSGQAGGNTLTPVPANQMWSRMSWVGLKSATAGEIRLGRDYTPAFTTVATYDPFGYLGVGAISNLFTSTQVAAVNGAFGPATVGASTLVRVNNALTYHSPANLGGFFTSAQIAVGENAVSAASGNSKFVSARAGYGAGPFRVEASFAETKNTNIAEQAFKEAVVGGWYDFGVAKVMAEHVQLKHVNAKSTVWLLGATAPVGFGTLKVSVAKVNQSGTAASALGATAAGASISDRDATQIAAGYTYDLSKRTALYGQLARVSNKGRNAGFSVSGGPAFAAGTDRKSTGYEFGLRHNF